MLSFACFEFDSVIYGNFRSFWFYYLLMVISDCFTLGRLLEFISALFWFNVALYFSWKNYFFQIFLKKYFSRPRLVVSMLNLKFFGCENRSLSHGVTGSLVWNDGHCLLFSSISIKKKYATWIEMLFSKIKLILLHTESN